jgi:hypothetical protein
MHFCEPVPAWEKLANSLVDGIIRHYESPVSGVCRRAQGGSDQLDI